MQARLSIRKPTRTHTEPQPSGCAEHAAHPNHALTFHLPLVAIAILFCTTSVFAAQPSKVEQPQAVNILREADKATEPVYAVQYDLSFDGTGAAEAFLPKITGTYRYDRWNDTWPKRFLFDVEIERHRTGKRHITAGCDGTQYYFVDHEARTIRTSRNSDIMDELQATLFACLIPEFIGPAPFDEEISGRSLSVIEDETVGDEACYQVHVVYDLPDQPETTWLISKKDALPRGRLDKREMPNGKPGWQRKRITNVVTNPDWPKGTFTAPSPEGYERIEEK